MFIHGFHVEYHVTSCHNDVTRYPKPHITNNLLKGSKSWSTPWSTGRLIAKLTRFGCEYGKVDQKNAHVYKIHRFMVKCLKVLVTKCCKTWDFFHDDLYNCVRYSNVEYQDELFKTYQLRYCSKVMSDCGFGCRFS